MLETLGILLLVSTLGILSPGPDLLLVLRNALTRSRAEGLASVAGICTGLLAHLSYTIAGIGVLVVNSPSLYGGLRYLGAAYLLYIGYRSFRAARQTHFDLDACAGGRGEALWVRYREGLLTNLLNPKVAFYLLAVYSQVIGPGTPVPEQLLYGLVFVVHALTIFGSLIWLGQLRRVQERLGAFQAVLQRMFGALLVGLGVKVALWG